MAIDTRAKRFGMLNFVSGFSLHVESLFEADGTVDADDRAYLLDLYGGIALDAPGGAVDAIGARWEMITGLGFASFGTRPS
ncbi:MAG: hypothetical protein GTO62_04820 [Planctomycetales bacterium]|nr:hypothetical protein [Planctomycetales bacterium]NIP68580.1 hypothetical protein [Planctomycetales bacterium]